VLVDEFQDTDPVQAEVLFLLASASDSGTDWSRVTLRDAALFVVGDPKQSIYRFRRADIETYQAARRIIEQQGAVLQLTANFRSLPAIATFVNTHFGERGAFPKKATPEQAAFARLEPAREDVNSPASVERYEVSAPSRAAGKAVVIALDAAQIATWVADAITNNEAKAGDVMVLSRKKEALAEIARQLSARGVPVAVTGAAVTLQAELQELSVVLQLMRDPNNPVLVVAALEGRFFGCSPADLWAAREASITFTVVTPPSPVPDDARALRVHEALTCLHRWLLQAHRDAPDVFLSRILAETGLLAWTASDELGDVRAGLLLRLVEEVRKASLDPETAGDAAYNALETLISNELPDAPLLPGRTDAVRVMNLHKAKGLEAKIVILAAPLEKTDFPPRVAVRRKEGRAIGAVQVVVKEGFQYRVIAQPAGWAQWQQDEAAFQNAEEERLRYVAATRACDRLLISEFVLLKKDDAERKNDREWSAFSPTLDALKIAARPMPIDDAAGRAVLQESPETVMQQAADADARRVQAAASSWAWKTVTGSAKAEYQARVALEDVSVAGRGAGAAWGRAVHRALEEAGRMGLPDVSKASALRFASEEHIPEQAEALHDVVNSVLCGPQWQVIAAAPARRFEWPVAGWKKLDGVPTYLEGVIDAAYQTPDGWHLIDWKTDDVDDAEWMRRLEAYHRQLTTYAELLAVATGGSVTHEIVRVR
jgi:ATP-dependent helicase/nuclease subunit A